MFIQEFRTKKNIGEEVVNILPEYEEGGKVFPEQHLEFEWNLSVDPIWHQMLLHY